MQGYPLHEVAVGQPFQVEVLIENPDGSTSYPIIQHDDSVSLQKTGYRMHTFNGASSAAYIYTACADEEGRITIGPARIANENVQSSTVSLQVTGGESKSIRSSAHKESFLRLFVDKDHAIKGEQIPFRLRFYYTDSDVRLQQIGSSADQEEDHIIFKKEEGPIGGTEIINGERYQYAEWRWIGYPTQTGTIVIPAYFADFIVPVVHEDQRLMHFASFFGSRHERKRVYSNAIRITIEDAPEGIKAIGSFSSLEASTNHTKVKQGEGIVLKLVLSGAGNLDGIEINRLVGMPSSARWYPSKQYLSSDKTQKTFEFVIQPMQKGVMEIPAQTFDFFDTIRRTQRTLKTATLSIMVMPSVQSVSSQIHDTQPTAKTSEETISQHELLPLNSSGAWYALREHELPFWLFLLLLIGPFFIWITWFLYQNFYAHAQKKVSVPSSAQAFNFARKKLRTMQKHNQVTQLYELFRQVIAARKGLSFEACTDERMNEILLQAGVDDQKWRAFMDTIAHISFIPLSSSEKKQLFEQVRNWLDTLAGVL